MKKCFLKIKYISFSIIFGLIVGLLSGTQAQASAKTNKTQPEFQRNDDYEKALLWGERFYLLQLNKLAAKQFEKAHKIKPGAYYPVYRLEMIYNRGNQQSVIEIGNWIIDFNKPGILIKALILVIAFSTLSFIIALTSVLFNRNKLIRVERRKQRLREDYQTMLVNYLFAPENSNDLVKKFREVSKSNFNRIILIDQMIDLSINLSGTEKEKLGNLYKILDLHKDSILKAKSRKWHIKAKGFRELAFMNIHDANDEIIRCLASKNNILRQEAQFALIRLNPNNSFGFLNELDQPLTLWEQLNVYETITFHQLPLPRFEKWLQSKNESVVGFAIRMIEIFKQQDAQNGLIQLLHHPNENIRNQVIRALGNFKILEALPELKKIYKEETYANCIAIIQAMARMPDESMLSFLKLIIDKEDDVQLQIEAAMAIIRMGEVGNQALVKMATSDYKNYQIIIKHVLDKRIN